MISFTGRLYLAKIEKLRVVLLCVVIVVVRSSNCHVRIIVETAVKRMTHSGGAGDSSPQLLNCLQPPYPTDLFAIRILDAASLEVKIHGELPDQADILIGRCVYCYFVSL